MIVSVPMKRSRMFMRGLILAALAWSSAASSSTFKPLPLSRLVRRSAHVLVGTPVSYSTHWATLGNTSRLVTDVTLEVSWTLRGEDVTGKDIIVRTLGGTVNGLAQIVYGEARLSMGQSSLLFLVPERDGVLHVLGMAQGQYPAEPDDKGDWHVVKSPGLEGVLRPELSAVAALSGKRLLDVPRMLDNAEATP